MSERLIQKASTLRKPKRSSLLSLPEKGGSAHPPVSVSRLGHPLSRLPVILGLSSDRASIPLPFCLLAFYLFIYTLPRVSSFLPTLLRHSFLHNIDIVVPSLLYICVCVCTYVRICVYAFFFSYSRVVFCKRMRERREEE